MIGNFVHLNPTLAFGLLGNIVSFMVFLSPLPTFYKVYKKKSTEGFDSAPYVVSLLSAMLWIYYALLKTNAMFLVTINTIGCFIQTFYICVFLFYAPKKARIESLKLIMLLIAIGFGLVVVLTQFLASGSYRVAIVGWICLAFSSCVFVAPLGVVKQVIKTNSVEYMPILLSLALTLNAVMWFFYGLLLGDLNIAVLINKIYAYIRIPNVLGFSLGIIQMTLYFVYKDKKPVHSQKTLTSEEKISEMEEQKISEQEDPKIIDNVKLLAQPLTCSDILPILAKLNEREDDAVFVGVEPEVRPNHAIEVVA